MQVSSPGRATPARNGLKRGKGKVSAPKTLPPHSKKQKLTGFTNFAALSSPFFGFLIPFCSIIHLQQVPHSWALWLSIDVFWCSKLHVFAQKREGFILGLLLVFYELRGCRGWP